MPATTKIITGILTSIHYLMIAEQATLAQHYQKVETQNHQYPHVQSVLF
jgi:hypothetical protein